ncbi:conserved hypothetical protein, secreted [Candidatus Magnetomorum sp. HK-1]|nr:conserved hypothetical protein, secreted [Candidatus Magnetomorum sp. HK-1]
MSYKHKKSCSFCFIKKLIGTCVVFMLSLYCYQPAFANDPYMCLMKCKVNCENYKEQQKELRTKGDQFGGPEDVYDGCIEPCFWRCDTDKGDGIRACRLEWDDKLGECLREERLSNKMCWQLWRKYSEKCFTNIK